MITQANAGMNFSTNNFSYTESYVKYCSQCATKAETLTTLGAAELLNVRIYDIYRKAEAGEIHSVATPHGSLMICRNSLVQEKRFRV